MTILYFVPGSHRHHTANLASFILYLLVALCLSLFGCDAPGDKIEPTATAVMHLQPRVTDPLAFQIYVDGELFDASYPYVKYKLNGVPVRVTETVSRRVIFDGIFPIRPYNGSFYVTIYQYRSGSIPVCILPPQEESLPPEGYSKVAFLYNFPDFPDEIKAVVENATTIGGGTYAPTDTLVVRKNKFSGFFLRANRQRIQVKLYTTGDNSTPIGMISNGQFELNNAINDDFTMYLAQGKSGSAGSQQITLEKAY